MRSSPRRSEYASSGPPADGATELRNAVDNGDGFTDDLKKQAAFRWLGDETEGCLFRPPSGHRPAAGQFPGIFWSAERISL
jgi:hypothetical protein